MRRLLLLVLVLLLVAAALNAERIGRHYYPFHYQEMIFHYAHQHSLDPYLLAALIKTESNFRSAAESPKGALGLMQIMPNTGRWIADQLGEEEFDPAVLTDPESNLMLGSWYLAQLFDEFNDDPILALAAYNGGRGNVQAWLREERWTGEAKNLEQIPFPETRQFVRKVLLNYRIYNFLYRN
ncbi:MAG: lytic transglycosylase domain-containing protein [Candidatus Desulforudis sp.]|nr:lytic transglycosylase domain-containing protein [Desulforudis sp.]